MPYNAEEREKCVEWFIEEGKSVASLQKRYRRELRAVDHKSEQKCRDRNVRDRSVGTEMSGTEVSGQKCRDRNVRDRKAVQKHIAHYQISQTSDALPLHHQKPVKVPTIPENPNSNLRKAVEKLREEKRPFLRSVYLQEYVWFIRSSSCNTDAELELMWTELLQAETNDDLDWTYSSWQRYQILRNSFYVLKKSRVYPSFLCCNCPVGIKDELCKHALLLMETEKLIDPLPRPLDPRRKRGRRKKVGRALERL